MFSLRGIPFVDLTYLRKSDLRDNVITYRRRKTGRPLSVTLTPEAMILVKKYMNRDSSSPYLFPFLESREGTKEAYREYQLALRSFNQQLMLLGELLGLGDKLRLIHCPAYLGYDGLLLRNSSGYYLRSYGAFFHYGNRDISQAFPKQEN